MSAKAIKINGRVTNADTANFGLFVLFQLLGETRVALGLEDEPSETFDRALAIAGSFAAIGGAFRGASAPFDRGPATAAEFRRQLSAAEPVIARLFELRPFMPPR